MTRAAVCTLALAAALGGCGAGDAPSGSPPAATTGDPVRAFAPLVHIHAREPSFPMSADFFIERATLEWSGGACPFEVNVAAGPIARRTTGEGAPPLTAARLGSARPYRHRPLRADCRSAGPVAYATTQHTRPFDGEHRPVGLPKTAGFNLDLLRAGYGGERRIERRDGQALLQRVPAYTEREPLRLADGRPGLRITYWMLYGRSESFGPDPDERVWFHEGDWIRVEVLVRRAGSERYAPVAVGLHREGDEPEWLRWQEIDAVSDGGDQDAATHPVVFAARGSHMPYAEPGRHPRWMRSYGQRRWNRAIDVAAACDSCPQWRTWQDLRDVRAEPWYGYGGGWGTTGPRDESSGVLGPSPFVPRSSATAP